MTEFAERAARYSDLFGERREHHTADCAYCPICATISVVRNTRPEVLEHLGNAAREFIAAATVLLEEAAEFIGQEQGSPEGNDGGATVSPIDRR